jgi:broad specificity phosphatase PhoE
MTVQLPASTTLYIVRHGETDWNREQRYQGQTDIPLNDTGRAQARRNGQTLRALLASHSDPVHFVASPLTRTLETMRLLRSELDQPPDDFARDDRLKEQHFGHWEGCLWRELPDIDPVGFAARRADMWGWTPRGGENYDMVQTRVAAWLATVRGPTVVVTHGNVSRTLRGLLLSLDRATIPKLEVPQDKLWRFDGSTGAWI